MKELIKSQYEKLQNYYTFTSYDKQGKVLSHYEIQGKDDISNQSIFRHFCYVLSYALNRKNFRELKKVEMKDYSARAQGLTIFLHWNKETAQDGQAVKYEYFFYGECLDYYNY